ncbi:MAG: C1 family peptidase [Oscillospiraceae bacterium]
MNPITEKSLSGFQADFVSRAGSRAAMNCVVKNGLEGSAAAFDMPRRMRFGFSVELPPSPARSQKKSGRCWMFAALNAMSRDAARRLNLEDFEFSQSYTMFYDKLEKSNFFLESILETAELPLTDRLISHLLTAPLGDGGQWDMFRSLIEKYGAVPKSSMPESFHSSNSEFLNKLLTAKLREYAATLRSAFKGGTCSVELGAMKNDMLGEVFRTLSIALGSPPETVNLELRNRDKKFLRIENLPPRDFFTNYVGWQLEDYCSLINAPTADKPYHKCYTVAYLGNVAGGHPVRYLNLPVGDLKKYAIAQLLDGKPVWFGCDVGKRLDREYGSMDLEGFDFESLLGYNFSATKAQRLDYHESLMTHAMVFTGVNLDENGEPNRWKVENSWGEDSGNKGYYVMSDAWFSEYLYQVLVDKRYLPETIRAELRQTPLVLQPWDPMGSLAM